MAAFLAIAGSTWPETVDLMVLKVFLYFLHTRLARIADSKVVNLS